MSHLRLQLPFRVSAFCLLSDASFICISLSARFAYFSMLHLTWYHLYYFIGQKGTSVQKYARTQSELVHRWVIVSTFWSKTSLAPLHLCHHPIKSRSLSWLEDCNRRLYASQGIYSMSVVCECMRWFIIFTSDLQFDFCFQRICVCLSVAATDTDNTMSECSTFHLDSTMVMCIESFVLILNTSCYFKRIMDLSKIWTIWAENTTKSSFEPSRNMHSQNSLQLVMHPQNRLHLVWVYSKIQLAIVYSWLPIILMKALLHAIANSTET